MDHEINRKLLKLWKTIQYDASYRGLMKEYRLALNEMQKMHHDLTEEQKSNVRAFQTSLSQLYEAMLKLALKQK